MTDHELEEKLARAVDHSTPDLLANILAACNEPESEGKPMTPMTQQPKKKHRLFVPLAAAAALALAVGLGLAHRAPCTAVPTARVALDVNPSLELALDSSDQLLQITACNPDAVQLLNGLELNGLPVEDAVDHLLDRLEEQGYLTPDSGTVLISVDAPDGGRLQQQLADQVRLELNSRGLNGSVLSQQVQRSEALEHQAQDWNTSFGRAAYYQKVADAVQRDPAQMAGLTVEQAEYLVHSRGLTLAQAGVECEVDDDVTVESLVGRTLIDPNQAFNIALEQAGMYADVKPGDLDEVELDAEHGRLVYDVEFTTPDGMEHEVTLDAQTGEVLKHEVEAPDPDDDDEDDDEDDDD